MGSEVPNLLEPGVAATLAVSQNLDIGVPVGQHQALKARLPELREFVPSHAPPPRARGARRAMTRTERRLRQLRSRLAVRAWDYRQRHHSRGVWYRLRRVLADASEAYAISPEDAHALLAERYTPELVGAELAPARTIIFADAERVARLASARRLALRLDADLLAAEYLALVRFPIAPAPQREG